MTEADASVEAKRLFGNKAIVTIHRYKSKSWEYSISIPDNTGTAGVTDYRYIGSGHSWEKAFENANKNAQEQASFSRLSEAKQPCDCSSKNDPVRGIFHMCSKCASPSILTDAPTNDSDELDEILNLVRSEYFRDRNEGRKRINDLLQARQSAVTPSGESIEKCMCGRMRDEHHTEQELCPGPPDASYPTFRAAPLGEDAVGETISHDAAEGAIRRLVNSHFNNPDQAITRIPARKDDDDLLLLRYIEQQRNRADQPKIGGSK